MNVRTTVKSLTSALAIGALLGMTPNCPAQDNTVGGYAFGIYAAVTQPVELDIPYTPLVELPPEGGYDFDSITLQVGDLVKVDALEVYTYGIVDADNGICFSTSQAETVGLHVIFTPGLNEGFIDVDAIQSDSTSFADGTEATSAGTVTILGLTIGTVDGETIDLGDLIDVGPNTVIDIPLVATLIINEQVPDDDSDGVTTSGLTVNALHVVDNGGLLGGEIIVASAYSRVSCSFGGGK